MTDNMPLILDNPMGGGSGMQVDLDEVDDLFGDGVPLNLSHHPPSKRLHQRLDELRDRGSCQNLAWGKSGTIASISPDGQSLELRYIRADPISGSWDLSEPTIPDLWQNLTGGPLAHLVWGPANQNSDLAVIDAVGRVTILNFGYNLNKPSFSRKWDADPIDDLHAVVGTFWLNVPPSNPQKLHALYGPAVKTGNNYQYSTVSVSNNPPWHPVPGRSALICVTTNGLLKMFWQQYNGRYEETTLELEGVTSADDPITHAAISGDAKSEIATLIKTLDDIDLLTDRIAKTLFVAMATASKQLRIAQVGITWSSPKQENPQNAAAAQTQISPTLHQRHVTMSSWLPTSQGDPLLDDCLSRITHLEFLQPIVQKGRDVPSLPTVLTVRSFAPAMNHHYNQDYNQEAQSIVDRWNVVMDQQTQHPAFEQLGNRRNSVGSSTTHILRLQKLEPIVIKKVVICITVIDAEKVVRLAYSDGSLEYRDRETMAELYDGPNLDRIHTILEAGFTQPGETSCFQTAVSPTGYSLVRVGEDGKTRWHRLEYTLADPAEMNDAQLSAVVAALSMSTAQAVFTGSNIDDIYAVTGIFPNKDRFTDSFISDMVSMMKMTVDYSEEAPHDHLFRNSQLQGCFSLLNHMGWKGSYKAREFRSKLCSIALSLRNTVILITVANNSHVSRGMTPMDEPDVVNSLAGCYKWSIDLLGWLCDSLFALLNDDKFISFIKGKAQLEQMSSYLHEKNEVALHLVLCSSTRSLLQAVCRRIALLDTLSQRAILHYERSGDSTAGNNSTNNNANASGGGGRGVGSPLHLAYRKIHQHTSTALIDFKEFESLLTMLGADIRNAYNPSKAKGQQNNKQPGSQSQPQQQQGGDDPNLARIRQHSELNLLLGRPPPNSFQEPLSTFFNTHLRSFREKKVPDPAELYFANFEHLELSDRRQTLAKRRKRGVVVDIFKRVEVCPPSSIIGSHGYRNSNDKSKTTAGEGDDHHGKDKNDDRSNNDQHSSTAAAVGKSSWRRCVRCASYMEEFPAQQVARPNLQFVLNQQRNCYCGGRMAVV